MSLFFSLRFLIIFFQCSGLSRYHEDDMAYGGLCQWSCVHHRRRRHRQTLRVSLCEITINLLILLLPGCIAGLTKFGYFSYVSCGRLCHLAMAVFEKGVCKQVTYVLKTHPNSHMLGIRLMKDYNIENPLHLKFQRQTNGDIPCYKGRTPSICR